MYRVLIVDDNRQFTKGSDYADEIVHVEHSWDAVAELRSGQFHEVWLDFDLHGDDKGSNVARFIRDNLDSLDLENCEFYIHSFNTSGRTSMQSILRDAGIKAIMTDLEHFINKPKITSFGPVDVEMDFNDVAYINYEGQVRSTKDDREGR